MLYIYIYIIFKTEIKTHGEKLHSIELSSTGLLLSGAMMRDQRAHQLEFIRFEIPNQSITESAAVLRTGEVVAVEVEFFKVCQGGGAARDAPCKLIRSQVEHDERRQPAHVRVHLAPDGVVA